MVLPHFGPVVIMFSHQQTGQGISECLHQSEKHIITKIRPLIESDDADIVVHPASDATEFRLTQRQLEVLHLISLGHPNKVIADLLEIKEQTIKIHINQIFKELRVFNRTQAVLRAQKFHLLSASTPVV